jgi:hypothetical protein
MAIIVERINIHVSFKYVLAEWMFYYTYTNNVCTSSYFRNRSGRDRMVVRLTTTCAISAYHH